MGGVLYLKVMTLKFKSREWLKKILNGTKVVEGRLDKDKKWSLIKESFDKGEISHLVMLYISEESVEKRKVELLEINIYLSFEEMLIKEGLNRVLPGKPTIEEGVNVYYGIEGYEEGERKKLGVVGIEIGKIEKI